ncbi:MAG: CvpA family protein [Bacteroidales bacterium]|nr:CvpA family protein [Bacteroidales bacterium]
MGVLDIVLLVIFIPAIIRGITKGFIEQLAALLSIFLSAYVAYLFADKVGAWLSQWITINSPTALYIISFVVVIILCVLVMNLAAKVLSKVIDAISLGWLNRILGFVIAIFNTALVLGILFVLFNDLNEKYLHLSTQFMQDSTIYAWIHKLTEMVFPYLEGLFTKISNGIQEI